MNRNRFLPFVVLSFILAFSPAGAQRTAEPADDNQAHCHKMDAAGALFHADAFSGVGDEYDVRYLRCSWEVDPAVHYIKGSVTTWFSNNNNPLGHLDFDLGQNMQVDSVRFHNLNATFTHTGAVLSISLPGFLPPGQLDSVTVYYQGAPAGGGFGTFLTSTHGGTPVMWTLSEPYGAREWWPCKQSLSDKADSIDVYVKTVPNYKVASNGLLKSVTNTGNGSIHHWHSKYPIAAYLVAFAVTNYVEFSDFVPYPGGNIEVLNYVYPEYLTQAQSESGAVVEIMQLFNDRAGLYPFYEEKYGHAQFGFGGGMEHQTMSFMVNLSYGLMAHELAHQWFGDKVTCGSWQDIWLNEGFATYFEGLTREAYFSPQTWYNWKLGKKNSITSQPGGSVFVPDTTDIGRIFSSRLSYSKGAYLLHMLRWKLGDTDFFQGLRNYIQDPDLAFGYARTADLQAHLEAVSGQNLSSFFQQWFYGEGYPSYTVSCSQYQGYFEGTLTQTTSMPASVPYFDIAVPIVVYGPGAQDSTLIVQPQAVGPATFSFLLPFEVDSVKFDPDLWILSNNNTVIFQPSATHAPVLEIGLRVSPNPVSEKLTVQGLALPGKGRIFLLDALGSTLAILPVQRSGSDWSMELDMRAFEPGIYFVKVEGADWVSRPIKVIK